MVPIIFNTILPIIMLTKTDHMRHNETQWHYHRVHAHAAIPILSKGFTYRGHHIIYPQVIRWRMMFATIIATHCHTSMRWECIKIQIIMVSQFIHNNNNNNSIWKCIIEVKQGNQLATLKCCSSVLSCSYNHVNRVYIIWMSLFNNRIIITIKLYTHIDFPLKYEQFAI